MRPSSTIQLLAATTVIFMLALPLAVSAQEEEPTLEQEFEELLDMANAYQTGFLHVVSFSAYQLYMDTGIITSDYANGVIEREFALDALNENSVLQSICVTSLERVLDVTPERHTEAISELQLLRELHLAVGGLLETVRGAILEPDNENDANIRAARDEVEQLLDEVLGEE
jgi:hypothetical protein